jgi:hypothetical protein
LTFGAFLMKRFFVAALARLLGFSREFAKFVLPILQDSAGRLLAQLAPIALEVVKSLADSPHSGAQKREAAIRQIQSLASAEGIRAGGSVVNLAVEIAVQNLKGK